MSPRINYVLIFPCMFILTTEKLVNLSLENAPDGIQIRAKQLQAIYNIVKGKDTLCLID